jgi:hypothetical protein
MPFPESPHAKFKQIKGFLQLNLTNAGRHYSSPAWGQWCPGSIITTHHIKSLLKERDERWLFIVTVWIINHKSHGAGKGNPEKVKQDCSQP